MTSLHIALRRGAVTFAVGSLVAIAAAGCAGPTSLAVEPPDGPFSVEVLMDPATLNPPQLATLNFKITERLSGRPVQSFTPLFGALLHNVLVSRDLLHFRHSYTGLVGPDGLSVLTNFPVSGEYFNHTVFQPEDAELQQVRAEIATGTAHMSPDLVPNSSIPRFSQGVQHQLVVGPEPLRAGQPSQLALFISEKGQPVTLMDPFLDGPGLMFVTDESGEHFAVEQGASESHVVSAQATGIPGTTATSVPRRSATAVPTRPATGGTPRAQQANPQQATGATEEVLPPPTLVPDVANALATITAQPVITLAPVQQTAMVSVIETPAVVPSVAYGPHIAFTHEFPEPGLYKLWFETSYRQRLMLVDFVVLVQ